MPVVEIVAGRLSGRHVGEAIAFRGIPYATAPRFVPPGPIEGWTGVRDAGAPGPAAPQPRRPAAAFTHDELPGTDEQCLSLNVFAPALSGSRPVFVWLHGGGFAIGHAAASLYSGERLAANADAVVVTVNYRLGSLGWLGHPGLAAAPDAPAANWGLLDQIAALEWVRDNIGAFGGDPGRVTLAGQSAGALSAMDLLVAPKAAGLFSRAVLESPPLGDVAQPPAGAFRWAEALSAAAGGAGDFDAPRLRELDAERIVSLHEELLERPAFRGTRGGALPTVDPGSLPTSPVEVPGASPDVDVLVGHTAQEGTFFFRAPWRPSPPAERIPGVIAHLCRHRGSRRGPRPVPGARGCRRCTARSPLAARRDRHRRDGRRAARPVGRGSRGRGRRSQRRAPVSGRPSRRRPRAWRHPHRRGAAPVRNLAGRRPRRAARGSGARCRRGLRRVGDGLEPIRARRGSGLARLGARPVDAGNPRLRNAERFAADARGSPLTEPSHFCMISHWTQGAKVCTVFSDGRRSAPSRE